jgi:metallo-beta-lactamase family protein
VESISGYSAHGDQADLLAFVGGMTRWPEEIRVVHGDDGAKQEFKRRLTSLYAGHDKPLNVFCP